MSWTISKIPKDKQKQIVDSHAVGDYVSILSIVHEYKATSFNYCCPTDSLFQNWINEAVRQNLFYNKQINK